MSASSILAPARVVDGMSWKRVMDHENRGVVQRADWLSTRALGGSTVFNPVNQRIFQIPLPTYGYLDTANSYLMIDIYFTTGGATGLALGAAGAGSIVSSLTLLNSGGTPLLKVDNVNHQIALKIAAERLEYIQGKGQQLGLGSLAQRQAVAAAANSAANAVSLQIDLSSVPIMAGDVHAPLFAQGLVIQVELAPYAQALVTSTGTGASYSVVNPRMRSRVLSLHQDYNKAVTSKLYSGRSLLSYARQLYVQFYDQLSTSALSQFVPLSFPVSDLHGYFFRAIRTADVNVMTSDEFSDFFFPLLSTHQGKWGTDLFPPEAVDSSRGGIDALRLTQALFGRMDGAEDSVAFEEGNDFTNFYGGLGRNFIGAVPMYRNATASFGGGYVTDNPQAPAELDVTLSGALSSSTRLIIYYVYNVLMQWTGASFTVISTGVQAQLNKIKEQEASIAAQAAVAGGAAPAA